MSSTALVVALFKGALVAMLIVMWRQAKRAADDARADDAHADDARADAAAPRPAATPRIASQARGEEGPETSPARRDAA